jgi:peptidoglycan/xylan/chitin deacetylase (PgdA/CDA1 family)
VEPIGSMDDYLTAYPVFTDYPQSGPYGLYQTENCMKSVAAIRDLCQEYGVNLVVVAGPVYGEYFENFDQEAVINFYTALAEVTPFWDFSNSSVSWEPRYFYDATHFRNNVGEMMAARIAGDDSIWIPEDFGTYVTADNAQAYFTERMTQPAKAAEDVDTQVPILMYHNLAQEADGDMTISVETFEDQIRTLAENGYTAITFDQLQAYVYQGEPLPENPVIITFDDGYLSNYELAWPILEQYGMKATIFAIGVSVGKDTYKDTGEAMTPHFSYEQAAEMVASGVISVQSHTYDMHQWAPFETGDAVRENILPLAGESEEAYVQALTEDFDRSRSELEAATGEDVDVLAYPSGAYSTLTQATLWDLGVRVTLSTNPGVSTVVKGLPQSLYGMKRIAMNESVSTEDMLNLLAGN